MAEEEQKHLTTRPANEQRELARAGFAFLPKTWEELYSYAKEISQTDFVPQAMRGKPGMVLAAWQKGQEVGLSPMAALGSICIINGRPSIYDPGYWSLITSSPLCEWFKETPPDEALAQGYGECQIKRRGNPNPIVRRFSMEEAKQADLLGKDNWKKYPGDMLLHRARHRCGEAAIPEASQGLIPAEIAREIEPRDITPTEREPPIQIPQPKQSGTVADFKQRQAEKAKPEIGGDLSNKVDPEHRKLADKMDELRREQEGKEDGERTKPVVDEVVPSKAGDGLRQGSERRDTAGADAPRAQARQEPPADGKSEPEKEPAAQKAGGEPEKLSLKEQIFAWIKNATTEELESRDAKVCYIREIFNNKKLLEKLTVEERTEVLQAYDKERRARP